MGSSWWVGWGGGQHGNMIMVFSHLATFGSFSSLELEGSIMVTAADS